jgi:hypothetical protein
MVRVFLISYHLRLLNDFHWRIALHKVYYTHKCTYTRKHTGEQGGETRGGKREGCGSHISSVEFTGFQRSGAVGACRAHNPEVVGSKLTFATGRDAQ